MSMMKVLLAAALVGVAHVHAAENPASPVYEACEKAMSATNPAEAWQWHVRVPRQDDGRMREELRRVTDLARERGFATPLQLDVEGADMRISGRVADVSGILRMSLDRFRRVWRDERALPENAPDSWREAGVKDAPNFRSWSRDVLGHCKYACSYRVGDTPECSWQEKTRRTGSVRTYDEFNRPDVWKLLAENPRDCTVERVMAVCGKPSCTLMLRCNRCDARDMRWAYAISDEDAFACPVRHTLLFSFSPNGRCCGWTWEAE